MKNRDSCQTDAIVAKSGDRVEGLLQSAAVFIPEHPAPDDIVAKALARLDGAAKPTRRPVFTFCASGALVGACALAAAAFIFAQPRSTRIRAGIARTPNLESAYRPKVEAGGAAAVPVVANRETAAPTRIKAVSLAADVPHERYPRHIRHRAFARTWPARIPVARPRTRPLPAHLVIATNTTAPPAQSGWTTEEVQETNYMLVSPGIVTEGDGPSEHATPVMVPIPIHAASSGASGESDAYTADSPGGNTH